MIHCNIIWYFNNKHSIFKMPYKPIDYSKCSIYKIEYVNNDKLIYIGSTTNFKQRK